MEAKRPCCGGNFLFEIRNHQIDALAMSPLQKSTWQRSHTVALWVHGSPAKDFLLRFSANISMRWPFLTVTTSSLWNPKSLDRRIGHETIAKIHLTEDTHRRFMRARISGQRFSSKIFANISMRWPFLTVRLLHFEFRNHQIDALAMSQLPKCTWKRSYTVALCVHGFPAKDF